MRLATCMAHFLLTWHSICGSNSNFRREGAVSLPFRPMEHIIASLSGRIRISYTDRPRQFLSACRYCHLQKFDFDTETRICAYKYTFWPHLLTMRSRSYPLSYRSDPLPPSQAVFSAATYSPDEPYPLDFIKHLPLFFQD